MIAKIEDVSLTFSFYAGVDYWMSSSVNEMPMDMAPVGQRIYLRLRTQLHPLANLSPFSFPLPRNLEILPEIFQAKQTSKSARHINQNTTAETKEGKKEFGDQLTFSDGERRSVIASTKPQACLKQITMESALMVDHHVKLAGWLARG